MSKKSYEAFVPEAPKGRYDGIKRDYSHDDVAKLRGSIQIRYTIAEITANRLWKDLKTKDYINALGAVTGNQAMQMVRAGLQSIYISGWQVAFPSVSDGIWIDVGDGVGR